LKKNNEINYNNLNLVYFTNTYPYGLGLEWKTNELLVFKKHFDNVLVVPFCVTDEEKVAEFIPGISYENPLFRTSFLDTSPFEKLFGIITSVLFFSFLREGFKFKVFFSLSRFKYWLLESFKLSKINSSKTLNLIIDRYKNENTIFYSYWGRDTVLNFSFLEKNKFHKVVCRFHGYDLYSERNDSNYLPFQKLLISKLDLILPCSTHGFTYLSEVYPKFAHLIFVARLGTLSKGLTKTKSQNDVFRIVSCSSVIPLKRVHLIAQAIKNADFPIEWIHIGDGIMMEELKMDVIKAKENVVVSIKLLGKIQSKYIADIYLKDHFDLFINVSSYEGVPVSIMEAMAAGIPILAPSINGIPEIVDNTIGKLIPAGDISPEDLWNHIKSFKFMKEEVINQLSKDSFTRYSRICNAHKNAVVLVDKLLSI
jgi:glycosyltransferase involved in cell wall biosynthesis